MGLTDVNQETVPHQPLVSDLEDDILDVEDIDLEDTVRLPRGSRHKNLADDAWTSLTPARTITSSFSRYRGP